MSTPAFLNHGIIGMVHLEALPGTPKYKGDLAHIVAKAVAEAQLYQSCGVDAVMVENMHDVPYTRRVGPEIVAAMTLASAEIRRALGPAVPLGVQVLAANNREALAVAQAAALDFVRVEGFVFGHVADEGYIDGCAGDLLRYRKAIGADRIRVVCLPPSLFFPFHLSNLACCETHTQFADIKKKHSSHAVTADVDIAETAVAAEYFLADGLIVTGASTGCEADVAQVKDVKKHVKVPVLVGSGCTTANVDHYLMDADSLIVGSYFKEGGYWENPVSRERVQGFMDRVRELKRA